VDHWVANMRKRVSLYEEEMVRTFAAVLRPDVPYLVVSQNDEGMPGRVQELEDLVRNRFPNVLVMSAGGYGNIPVPLVKQNEPKRTNRIPAVENRPTFASYVGSMGHAPKNMRQKMHDLLTKWDSEQQQKAQRQQQEEPGGGGEGGTSHGSVRAWYKYYHGPAWRQTMFESKFSLTPRGFRRTAYHVVEIWQNGLIPIHVFSDVPWVPYQHLWHVDDARANGTTQIQPAPVRPPDVPIGFAVHYEHVDDFFTRVLLPLSDDQIRAIEERIGSLRATHFEIPGIMQQIDSYMLASQEEVGREEGEIIPSDLSCQALPDSVRDK